MRSKRLILLACASLLPASSIYASYSDAQQAAASGDIEAAIQHYIAEAANSNSPLAEASLWEAARLQLDKQKFADFTATASQFQQKYPNTEKAHWLEFWAACVPIYEGKAHVAYPQLKTLSADPKLPELATPIRDALATADEARFLAAQQAFATQNYAAVPA
jgi:outer membrane protein assembly factor BamD (BamD/ComL family)